MHAKDSHPLEFQTVNERALDYGHQQGVVGDTYHCRLQMILKGHHKSPQCGVSIGCDGIIDGEETETDEGYRCFQYRTERFENPKGLEETDLPSPDLEGSEEPDLPGPDGNGIFLGGPGPVPGIFLGGPAPVGEQRWTTYTSDPNFIGGSKAVELAVQEMKSLRAADSTITRHEFRDRLPSQKKILKRQKSFGNHSTGSKLTLDDLLEKLRNSHASSSYVLLKSHSGNPQEQHMITLTPTVSPASSNRFPSDILTKYMLKQCDSSASDSYVSRSYALMEIRISYPKEQHMIPPTPDVSHASSNWFPSDILTKSILKQCDSSASGSYALMESRIGYPKEQHMVSPTPTVPPTFSNRFPSDILTKRMLKQCDSSNEKLRNSHASDSYASGSYALLESHSVHKSYTVFSGSLKTAEYSSPIPALSITSREDELSECWKSSYLADVLKESGFYNAYTDMLMATKSSLNFPMGYFVFQNLENKYCGKLVLLKNERKLLFDRINKALSEIYQSNMNLYLLIKSWIVQFDMKLQKCKVRDKLHKLLEIQEKEALQGSISVKLFEKETQ
ncbi:hypothetical protein POM88_000085 [Heracleum sosnowskyi]|uniref:DUF4378 domain-containing protein n=1 Tax=Heracleum sosnowskyi TaxID=360622 RepID=A0AAD8JDI7_9APIA|nr:hypothetical protein POM88_000085 [Heracleum sosnowskyi]